MRFKTTAVLAACVALAPAAFAEGTKADTGTTSMNRGSGSVSTSAHASMSSDQVRQIQQALSDRGFDPGPVDGVMGPKTRQAMRNFRQAQGLSGGDSADSATLSALGVDSTASSSAGGTTGSRAGTTGTTGSETPPTTSTGSTSMPTTPGGSQMPSTSTGPMGSSSMGGTPSNSTNTRNPSSTTPDNRGATGTDSYGTSGQKR
jgi:peptidoglycan hydrolase-like protein with peptidoglycan-binding domain